MPTLVNDKIWLYIYIYYSSHLIQKLTIYIVKKYIIQKHTKTNKY